MTTERSDISIPIYTVDSFSTEPFRGNPAAVCLVPRGRTFKDETLQAIAAEMNLSDTAFVELLSDNGDFKNSSSFKLRWFTPTSEVPLCGHATLASAAVLFFACENISAAIQFDTASGTLTARRSGEMITLDFPLNETQPMDREEVRNILKNLCEDKLIDDVEYSASTKNLLVRSKDDLTRTDLENLKVDTKALQDSEQTGKVKGVIVSLKGSVANNCTDKKGSAYDFVSRYFVPWIGIAEDPVTGSAHTVLAGYWRKHLGKSQFRAYQCSKRGGEILCSINGDRVELTGAATIVLKGEIFVPYGRVTMGKKGHYF